MRTDLEKYIISHGINGSTLDGYGKSLDRIISPTIIEERHMNVASMDVFSALAKERIIYLSSVVDEDSSSIINALLLYYDSIDPESDIKMYINSPGGSVVDGLSIYDTMNLIAPDVATFDMGMAASMGSILLSSGTKGKRYCLPHSRVMIHQVSSEVRGKMDDLKISVAEAEKHQNELYNILAENTGKSFEQISQDASKDCWFTAKEALDYGLIDKILTKKSK